MSDIWSDQSLNEYSCTGTLTAGYCILPLDSAKTTCDKDSNCLGYVVPTLGQNLQNWLAQYPNSSNPVQLVSKIPITSIHLLAGDFL